MQTLESFQHFFSIAALAALFLLGACTSMWPGLKSRGNDTGTDPFEIIENQAVFDEGKVAPDVALFNMGVISAYSLDPEKDYPRALVSFRTITQDYPQSPLVEQARFWIQVLEEHQKMNADQRQFAEEKRALSREREMLNREKEILFQAMEKLKYTAAKSHQVDIEIEKRRRQTLQK